MDDIIEITDIELTGKQQFAEVLFAASVAFGAGKIAEKAFKEAVKAIRNHKASK